jgi:fructose-1,6-bisphosphatase II / sedoheptulose-1,7-bisphosphatase
MTSKTMAKQNLALETVRVTETAAIAAEQFMGTGDEKTADQAAAEAMHGALNKLDLDGNIRIGEGMPGEAEKLFLGEKIGAGESLKMDVTIVALEGKILFARSGPNAITVITITEDGKLLKEPNIYMEKVSVGPGFPEGIVDLDKELGENLNKLSQVKRVGVSDIVVCKLDRPRQRELIVKVREAGARIRLIFDSDIFGVIATAQPEAGVDMFLGTDAAPQGVLATVAPRCTEGQMQGRLVFRNKEGRNAVESLGTDASNLKFSAKDLASGNVTFATTGFTHSDILEGMKILFDRITTHSIVWRSINGALRYIQGNHNITHWPKKI